MLVNCGRTTSGDVDMDDEEYVSGENTEYASEVLDLGNPKLDIELDILTSIQIEAGRAAIIQEDLFSPYKGQSVVFEKKLSTEELATAGQTYKVPVLYQDKEITLHVEIIDTTPPVIDGVSNLSIIEGESVFYKKNITLSDNSNQEVTLEVDNSQVNLNASGSYPVRYTATDASGNQTVADITVTVNPPAVPTETTVRELANQVIAETVTSDMSQYDKAYALWLWCGKNISYTYADGDRSSVWTGAYEGLHDRCGDCYAYYATYAVLLDCCDIPNMCVARVGGNSPHWWNLVNTGSGWYHCDTSPRNIHHPYSCFMQTDAQIQAYAESYPEKPNYYTFDESLYPERATTIVYGN